MQALGDLVAVLGDSLDLIDGNVERGQEAKDKTSTQMLDKRKGIESQSVFQIAPMGR